ncbi:MAG: ATP-binding protein [Pseudomonadota bacterium]
MIVDSIAFMTLFDVLIIGIVIYSGVRIRKITSGSEYRENPVEGLSAVLAGLTIIAVFYLADLAAMYFLPPIVGHAAAMDTMRDLHLNYRWIVSLIAVGLIAYGLLAQSQAASRVLTLAKETEHRLLEQVEALEQASRARDEAELAVRETQARYQKIFEFSPIAMYLHDGTHIREANPATASLFRYDSPEDMRGVEVLSLLDEADRPQYLERLAEMRANPRTLPFVEDRRVTREGDELIVEQAGTPIEFGSEALIFAINRDLTATREAESMLRQSQKMEAVGQLTGGVAHDFNNLMSVILGNVELIRVGLKQGLSCDRYLSAVEQSIQRGADLTGRLLSYSRRQALSPEPIDLNELVTESSELMRRTLGERIELRTIRSAGLWNISADRTQLETALLNLVLNARDAMPQGGKLTIEIANTEISPEYARNAMEVKAGRYAVLAVSDTGSGMEKAVLERIFEPFYSTKAPGHGTGLGLSMVFGFVKQSGGHVTAYSEPGVGTTIRIYLPKSNDDARGRPEVRADTTPENLRRRKVLLVEDDDTLRQVIASMLQGLGMTVEDARDAGTARTLAAGFEPDLLLTDVILPGQQNGRELAEALESEIPGLSVLYMSGYTENAILHDGRLDEGVHLLSKPFSLQQLQSAIAAVLA